MATDKIKKIVEDAIPLTMDCEIKRSAEIKRRARLRIDIEELIRQEKAKQPFKPELEYKGGLNNNVTIDF
jgi:hypothetical protein